MSSGFSPATNLFGVQPHLPVPAAGVHFPPAPSVVSNPYYAYTQLQSQRIKLKRTRQRVDAGEPRNTYSSIPSYSSTRVATNPPMTTTPAASASSRYTSTPNSVSYSSSAADQMNKLFQQAQQVAYASAGVQDSQNLTTLLPQMHNAWVRLQQQVLQQSVISEDPTTLKEMLKVKEEVGNGNDHASANSPCKVCDENGLDSELDGRKAVVAATEDSGEELETESGPVSLRNNPSTTPSEDTPSPHHVKVKKARVETIINSIQSGPSSPQEENNEDGKSLLDASFERSGAEISPGSRCSSEKLQVSPKSKRKQYQPQQVEAELDPDQEISGNQGEEELMPPDAKTPRTSAESEEATEDNQDQGVMNKVQELFAMQRQWWLSQYQKKMTEESEQNQQPCASSAESSPVKETDSKSSIMGDSEKKSTSKSVCDGPVKDLKSLAQTLKTELISSVSSTVDKILNEYIQAEAARFAAAQQRLRNAITPDQAAAAFAQQQQNQASRNFYLNPALYSSGFPYNANPGMNFAPSVAANPSAASIFPGFGNPYMSSSGFGTTGPTLTRKEDTFSLVMPQTRKKRPKVTDTRLGKVPVRGDESRNSPATGFGYPPTMVGHPLYGATFSGIEDRDGESPANSDDISELGPYDPSMPQREFYYIQMEKYARQALAEGIRSPEDITVTTDSELYKVLNQHYNRNNHIQVPPSFRDVVEATLREFFLAIQANKDVEPSWKKQIYKVIARLDDTIPEYFKNPNFLEQLEN